MFLSIRIFFQNILLTFISFGLLACGGGGGSVGVNAGSSNPALSFSPSAITVKQGETESTKVSMIATPQISFSGNVYVFIIDNTGVIEPNAPITKNLDNT